MYIRKTYCIQCGDEFLCRRSTAKFCSNACKLQYRRWGSKMNQSFRAADSELIEMLRLVDTSPYWHSSTTLGMIENLEFRLKVLKQTIFHAK